MPPKAQPAVLDSMDFMNPVDGSLWMDLGNIYSDGAGNFSAASFNASMGTAAAVAIATGNTVAIPAGTSVVRLAPAAAVTGIILPAGTRNGQILWIINTSAAANTITFAAVGTSLVAGGAGVSLAGLAAHAFVWDAVGALWYQVGPLAN